MGEVDKLLHNVRFSILINGEPAFFFSFRERVKTGDLLSPSSLS